MLGRFSLIALLFLGGCLSDTDGDGTREILFAGDSNTKWAPCAYPQQWQARHDPAILRGYNEGRFGTTAHFWLDSGAFLASILRRRPDAVVIALGTNDIGQDVVPTAVVQDLLRLYGIAEEVGVRAYIATVPPVYDPEGAQPELITRRRLATAELNDLIRDAVPRRRVVDFDSWMPDEWDPDYMVDGVHLNCSAHTLRADRIDALW